MSSTSCDFGMFEFIRFLPRQVTDPEVAESMPVSIETVVVFPAPL